MATSPSPQPKMKSRGLQKNLPAAPSRPGPTPEIVSASKAKAHLLELLDTVSRDRKSITITKRGHPVATLVPVQPVAAQSIFGCMKGTGKITGDVVGPESDVWNAMVE